MNKRISVTLELTIDEDSIQEQNMTVYDVLDAIKVIDNEDLDGCLVTTVVPGLNPASDILLGGCRLVSKELKFGPVLYDDKQFVRDRIREDINVNGELCYGLSDERIKQLTETEDPLVETMVAEAYAKVMDGDTDLDTACDQVIEKHLNNN